MGFDKIAFEFAKINFTSITAFTRTNIRSDKIFAYKNKYLGFVLKKMKAAFFINGPGSLTFVQLQFFGFI